MTKTKTEELVLECKRQFENCLYTSTALHIWLRSKRGGRIFLIAAPLVLGAFSTWKLMTESSLQEVRLLASACALLAGVVPSIYAALKLDEDLKEMKEAAAEFTNLRDRFRQTAAIWSKKPFGEFEAEFLRWMGEMDKTRSRALTPPEWAFKRAQKKVQSGDYDFDVDLAAKDVPQEATRR
ncbi:MAG TPA: hypothetical protein VK550_16110 [Polyangiaceae bacterium]|nr:hypothetical protein [Polyangiaceae bacterium]